jgi:hypothetical protein
VLIFLAGTVSGAIVSMMLGGGCAWAIGIAVSWIALLVAASTSEP